MLKQCVKLLQVNDMFLYYYDFDMCGYSVELVERTNDVIVRVEILKYGTSMHHASMCDLPL